MNPILLTPTGELPNGLTPERLAELGLTPVVPTEQPTPEPGMRVTEATPEWVDGVHQQRWVQVPMPEPRPEATQVPPTVSMRQARLALLGAGLLSSVDAAINGLPEPQRSAARIEWEYATDVRRDAPFLLGLTQSLGMTPEQLDALFVAASNL